MKKYLFGKTGYTLVEMLIAVSIIVVLLAIAIPSVIYLRTSLKMTELDDIAREIYIGAQNRLSAMKASGELSEFNELLTDQYDAQNLTVAFGAVPPGDFGEGDSQWQGYYYLSSEDEVTAATVMSASAFADAGLKGYYVIELDPRSGDVYSVFYSEAELLTPYREAVYSMRAYDERKKLLIGYYCGSGSGVSDVPDAFSPSVQVVNKEELYLAVTCYEMRSIAASQNNLTVTLTLQDEHGGAWTADYVGYSDFTIDYDKMTLNILLDSMRGGASFAELTGLYPGDNITAVVSMEYSYRGIEVSTDPAYPATVQFNSLFASKTDEGITVSSLRHLNNLRSGVYTHEGTAEISVTQAGTINFDADKWDGDALCPTTQELGNPLASFDPIVNETLFGSASGAGIASFEGGNICDMVIGGGQRTGLFSYINCDVSGVRLIDPAVTGGSYTGALAGVAYGGTVSDCGVYLTTKDQYGNAYGEEAMAVKVAQRAVTASAGSTCVGGLLGSATSGVTVESSFAAIDVKGAGSGSVSIAGGLVGTVGGAVIRDCYASGDVTASSQAGGLVGVMSSGSCTNCYSTSDVVAGSYGGGFAGTAGAGASISACAAYGSVLKADGNADLSTSGPFISRTAGASVTDCVYLRQNGYNEVYDSVTVAGVAVKTYTQLRPAQVNDPLTSFPYTGDDDTEAFPFAMVCAEHHGDWPEEYKIETSLAYYEKYQTAGGQVRYGYYAEGYSTGGSSEEGGNEWTLDTLMTQSEMDAGGYYLAEDGYAIVSIYNLVRMVYQMNGGTATTMNVSATPGTNKFVLIRLEANLEFETADGGSLPVEFLYVFQLPFALQETNRNSVGAFYDTLKLTCYAEGNLEEPVMENNTFYYCPHFAKNAINPDVRKTTAGRPADPSVVYVRSPRQLNALGRYSYYWNHGNNPGNLSFEFYQEIDLDFAKYTRTYCGFTFNLMDTSSSNTYRNRPIGRPMAQSFTDWNGNTYTPANFQNIYDGQYYEIIDYCLYSYSSDKYQFTGLFGEIYRATIRNVVMVASDPDNTSGYVISEYNTGTHRPGTGALVGLIYIDGSSESAGVNTVVTNCAVKGYTVIYTAGTVQMDSVVGGLCGYAMGYLTNSSSDCKLVKAQVTNDNGKNISVGGLCGSINGHRVSNCYAGGTLVLSATTHTSSKSSIGGVAGGYSYLWNSRSSTAPFESLSVTNCYSFCTVNSGTDNYYAVYGVSGNRYDANAFTVTGCYYLEDAITGNISVSAWNGAAPLSFMELSALSLSDFGDATAERTYPWSEALYGTAFPFPAVVKNRAGNYVHYGDWTAYYPQAAYVAYYEVYSDGSYGYYYYDDEDALVNTLDMADAKTISQAGYGLLRLEGTEAELEITDAGGNVLDASVGEAALTTRTDADGNVYALYPLTSAAKAALSPAQGAAERLVNIACEITGAQGQELAVYVNVNFGAAFSLTGGQLSTSALPLQVRTQDQLCAVALFSPSTGYFKQTHAVVAGTAPATATYGGDFKAGFRYDGNGSSVWNLTLPMFNSNAGEIKNLNLWNSVISASGSLTAALSVRNSGTITGCTVYNAQITVSGAAGGGLFVGENSGTITGCYVDEYNGTCAITGTSGAPVAGFALTNSGTIGTSVARYVTVSGNADAAGFIRANAGPVTSCQVVDCSVGSTANASGFVFTNAAGRTISSCGAVLTPVSAGGSASGFADSNAGTISYCYVSPAAGGTAHTGSTYDSLTITGAQAYGFGRSLGGSVSYSYAVASVSGASKAAGFGDAVTSATTSYANCKVSASSGPASGFIFSGGATYCYSAGSVSGTTRNGFMSSGTASYCYSVCALAADGYGFSPKTGVSASNCYWVKDTNLNTSVTAANSAGTSVTFAALRALNWITTVTGYPFTASLGGTYPYAISYMSGNVPHYGDWPVAPVSYQGIIGAVKVKYNYSYYPTVTCGGYRATGMNAGSSTTTGPSFDFLASSSTFYYVYISNDLIPSFGGISSSPASSTGWVVRSETWLTLSSATTVGDYTCYQISGSSLSSRTLRFYLNGVEQFRVRLSDMRVTIQY